MTSIGAREGVHERYSRALRRLLLADVVVVDVLVLLLSAAKVTPPPPAAADFALPFEKEGIAVAEVEVDVEDMMENRKLCRRMSLRVWFL